MIYLIILIVIIIILFFIKSNSNVNSVGKEKRQRQIHLNKTIEKKSGSSANLVRDLQNDNIVDEKWDNSYRIIPYREYDCRINKDNLLKMYAYLSTEGTTSTYTPVYIDQTEYVVYVPAETYHCNIGNFTKSTVILRESNGSKRIEASILDETEGLHENDENECISLDFTNKHITETISLTEENQRSIIENAGKLIINPQKEETIHSIAYDVVGDIPEQCVWQKEWKDLVEYALPNTELDVPDDYEWANALGHSIYYKLGHRKQYEVCESLLNYPGRLSRLQQCWILDAIKWILHDSNWAYRSNNIAADYEYLCGETIIKEIFMQCIGQFPGLNASLAAYSMRKCDADSLHEMLSAYLLLDQNAKIEFYERMNSALDGVIDDILAHNVADVSAVEEELRLIDTKAQADNGKTSPFHHISICLQQGISIKKTLQDIKRGIIWKNESEMIKEKDVWVYFIYPNGKQGDIDMAIASMHGQEIKLEEGIVYKVRFNCKDLPYAEQMVERVYNFPHAFEATDGTLDNRTVYNLLSKYNNYHTLQKLADEFSELESLNGTGLQVRLDELRQYNIRMIAIERNNIYDELLRKGMATSGWKSEQQVYALVAHEYPDAIFQYHTYWLGAQSLDVFIPSLSIGIEYQGLQHYEPVDIFGGEVAYDRQVKLDKRKKRLCNENGVKLVYWEYYEPITKEELYKKINSVDSNGKSL